MGEQLIESIVTIALAIVGIAALAVLVSGRAQTTQIIGASGAAFSQSLATAEEPVLSSAEMPGINAYY
jgi:hypothetical protein